MTKNSVQQFFSHLIGSDSADPDRKNRELVLNAMLLGLTLLAGAAFIGIMFELIIMARFYLWERLLVTFVVAVVFGALFSFSRKSGNGRIVAFIVVFLLALLGTSVVYTWGILVPIGTLLFGLTIVAAGVLIDSLFSLYAAVAFTVVLFVLEVLKDHQLIRPDFSWTASRSSMGDVFAFFTLFSVLALVSWLFNHQMERSLEKARLSEKALQDQKDLLEIKVKQRTRELEAAQLDKVQQVYRLAELGRISSALFHDLANHLSSVSLDIEGLGANDRSELTSRIQQNISYVDEVVQKVRQQLRGNRSIEHLNVKKQLDDVLRIVSFQMNQKKIKTSVRKPAGKIYINCDEIRFRQILINLISNSIDAFDGNEQKKQIFIELGSSKDTLKVRITDWGKKIDPFSKKKIFEPFYSSKKNGVGIGLFIVKQIVRQDLKGKIELILNDDESKTFVVTLPKN